MQQLCNTLVVTPIIAYGTGPSIAGKKRQRTEHSCTADSNGELLPGLFRFRTTHRSMVPLGRRGLVKSVHALVNKTSN